MSGDSPRDEVLPAGRARQRGESAADRAAQAATRIRELSDDRQPGHRAALTARQAVLAEQMLAVARERAQAAVARAAAAREASARAHDRAAALLTGWPLATVAMLASTGGSRTGTAVPLRPTAVSSLRRPGGQVDQFPPEAPPSSSESSIADYPAHQPVAPFRAYLAWHPV